ncbi:GPW/gp25 family protein [Microbacterium sp. A93]|uniref:GPW/gp25 family protein n=1 Tax=Microbacterium sp. A93 TaxID=3450716 RepID=UPI003F42F52F
MRTMVGFPLRLDARGRVDTVSRERWLASLVEQVLFTRPGERLHRPGFGSGLLDLVFEPIGAALAETTTALVTGALQDALGDLLRVEEVSIRVEETAVHVTVRYQPHHLPAGESRSLTVSSPTSPTGSVGPTGSAGTGGAP